MRTHTPYCAGAFRLTKPRFRKAIEPAFPHFNQNMSGDFNQMSRPGLTDGGAGAGDDTAAMGFCFALGFACGVFAGHWLSARAARGSPPIAS